MADLDLLRGELHAALENSTPVRGKTVLQAMIDGIRIDARDSIEPTFRVPAVREPCGSMVRDCATGGCSHAVRCMPPVRGLTDTGGAPL